ncbi:glutamate ligase domain-containing protein [Chitinivibrio alkaliphilus]|uniref:UDP-N-acetylmuramate-alanine ligase n=1 Tax=Chitinivibrio alkaliphilus ACht1 TaxID=1313304 RepID=U7D9A6_9BACT|nr:cyanophycin synthetase [Chitinivibrio alkaliphilus]ERP38974.1 UDP-N-acetylmuramate-alanine ligase [Chitinivibrio alkaliphilus ACht1]
MSILIEGVSCSRLHFAGIFGVGMSALAQYLAPQLSISGSDRDYGKPHRADMAEKLRSQHISITPQDGSALVPEVDALVVSTAVDEDTPDVQAARRLAIPVLHRSQVLAAVVRANKTIAVTGTSGKSTVSAQIFHILQCCGYAPSYIGGANLTTLVKEGLVGNSYRGSSSILVIEADESDGTVVRYHADTLVVLNVSRDHREEEEVVSLMNTAARQARHVVVPHGDDRLREIGNITFGAFSEADFSVSHGQFSQGAYSFCINTETVSMSIPGRYVAENCAAAAAGVSPLGVPLKRALQALESYGGIERRFDIIGTDPVTVIDDYAHNPDKLKNAMEGARFFTAPLTVVFQPHGYGPLRFLFEDLRRLFEEEIGQDDSLIVLPVFYAGGRVDRRVTSQDLAKALDRSIRVYAPRDKNEARKIICRTVSAGTVLVAGARDVHLSDFARGIYSSLRGSHDK